MATLPDPKVSPQDVARIVSDKNLIYQPEGPRIPGLAEYQNRPSNATPAAMKTLLEELSAYTDAVQAAAAAEGLTDDAVQIQWQMDMANWRARLGHYYDQLKTVDPAQATTLSGADQIYYKVTMPLLDGTFKEVLPGISLTTEERERMKGVGPSAVSNRKPNDIYVPFSLGNQVLQYREHQRERWDKFWEDILAGLKEIPRAIESAGWTVAPWLIGAAFFIGATALGGVVIYGLARWRQPRMYAPPMPPPQAPRAGMIGRAA